MTPVRPCPPTRPRVLCATLCGIYIIWCYVSSMQARSKNEYPRYSTLMFVSFSGSRAGCGGGRGGPEASSKWGSGGGEGGFDLRKKILFQPLKYLDLSTFQVFLCRNSSRFEGMGWDDGGLHQMIFGLVDLVDEDKSSHYVHWVWYWILSGCYMRPQ